MAAAYIEPIPERTMEVSVEYMTNTPAVGHLVYIIHYPNEAPSQQEILVAITPYILQILGGNRNDWMIESLINTIGFRYNYSFDWIHLNNKERMNPIMRTITFRPMHHQFEIYY
jgi:hypothetical protein